MYEYTGISSLVFMQAAGRASEGNSLGARNPYSPYVARVSVILEDKLRRGEHHSEVEFGENLHTIHTESLILYTQCV